VTRGVPVNAVRREERRSIGAMSPRTTLPRATDALIEPDDPPDKLTRIVREKHTLLERHAFERVGTTTSQPPSGSARAREEGSEGSSSFAVRPPVMHFGGFELGKTHTQTFVVTNTGATSRRLVVIDPTTEHFRVVRDGVGDRDAKKTSTRRKYGKLAPGASEAITVAFTPMDGVRYYYDCCRVHAEAVPGLVLPVHAYPVMNEVTFPRAIDFGACVVGETRTRKVTMTCAAPIAFEYELIRRDEKTSRTVNDSGVRRKQRSSACFSVTPSFGIVPAEGSATVSVTFSPTTAATATLELEVRVAQFGFEPFACRVRGVGFPANVPRELRPSRDQSVNFAPGARFRSGLENGPEDAARYDPRTPAVRKPKPPETKPLRADALVAAFELRAAGYAKADAEALVKRGIGPRGRKLSARAVCAPRDVSSPETLDGEDASASDGDRSAEELIDGVFVPRKLRGASDFARVLSQKPGKLRVKDIEKAMAARDSRARAAATLRASVATAAGAVAKMKASAAAAAFRKLLAAATRPRAFAHPETEETETLRSPAEMNGTNEEEESSSNATGDETLLRDGGGYAALRGVFEAARFRSRSEDETMAALDDPSLEPEVKAHVFEREFERVRQFEKKKEWTECVAVGEARRTDAQDAAAAERRRAREAATRYAEASAAMAGLARGDPPADGARYDARRGGGDAADPEVARQELNVKNLLTFNPLSADDWPKRREALDRFAQAGRRVIVRNRAEKRLRGARRLLRASRARESGEALLTEEGAAAFFSQQIARDVTETMARSTDDAHTKVLEQTLDPARRAFARARAEEVREARLGVARLDALASLFQTRIPNSTANANALDGVSADDETPSGRVPSTRPARRSPLFPVVRASAFTRRHAVDDAEMARSAIAPWEEVAPLPLATPPTRRARGHRLDAEGAPPALEGDGAPPGDAGTKRFRCSRAGAQEEETSGVGVPARLVLATDEATAATAKRERAAAAAAAAVAATLAPDAKPAWEGGNARRPARFPPRVSSFATPGPSSRDRVLELDALLPATYGHDDSLASEPAGMNAVVAAARGDERRLERLARFAPRAPTAFAESVFSAAPPDAWAAEWMSGPDPRDIAEGEGEGDTPAAAPAPTLASVAEEVARALRLPSAGTSDASDAAFGFANPRDALVVPGGVAARALVERESDAAAVSEREARMRRLETRAAEIDAAVADPRTRWRLEG